MAANDFEYYLISNTDDYDVKRIDFLYSNKYVNINKPIYLVLNPPILPKPNFEVDYLQFSSAIFSQKIANVLLPMNIKGHQLVPAIIVDKKGKEEHPNFWIENAYTSIKCFDNEASVYEIDDFTDTWENVKKIVLDKERLNKIPLKERLIVMPQETREFGALYHKSIIDVIMSVNPINIKFIPIDFLKL